MPPIADCGLCPELPVCQHSSRPSSSSPRCRAAQPRNWPAQHALPKLLCDCGHVNQVADDRMIFIRPSHFAELGPERHEGVQSNPRTTILSCESGSADQCNTYCCNSQSSFVTSLGP